MNRKKRPNKEAYIEGVLAGDRVMLSRAITLVESKLQADRELAEEVMDALMPHTGKSFRLGITGVPGVGKSTFIARFGKEVVGQGHKLAVLAIDPSSPASRGSILGDKTRMGTLAADPRVYVRPSSAGGALGGISANTREGSLICEAAGFDFIIIETVGVGQSEVSVRHMVDAFLLLLLPGAGDELQGLKKGIVEMADILVVNKADGQSVSAAREAQRAYSQAMKLFSPKPHNFPTKVLTCSSLTGDGIESLWNELTDYWQLVHKSGYLEEERRSQRVHWAKTQITDFIAHYFYAHPSIKEEMPKLLQKVREGEVATLSAARKLMELFLQN